MANQTATSLTVWFDKAKSLSKIKSAEARGWRGCSSFWSESVLEQKHPRKERGAYLCCLSPPRDARVGPSMATAVDLERKGQAVFGLTYIRYVWLRITRCSSAQLCKYREHSDRATLFFTTAFSSLFLSGVFKAFLERYGSYVLRLETRHALTARLESFHITCSICLSRVWDEDRRTTGRLLICIYPKARSKGLETNERGVEPVRLQLQRHNNAECRSCCTKLN